MNTRVEGLWLQAAVRELMIAVCSTACGREVLTLHVPLKSGYVWTRDICSNVRSLHTGLWVVEKRWGWVGGRKASSEEEVRSVEDEIHEEQV